MRVKTHASPLPPEDSMADALPKNTLDDPGADNTNLIEATQIMARNIRRYALIGIHHAGSGHPGGSLSCADMLACLGTGELQGYGPDVPDTDRDRLILSKGHAAPALYGLGVEAGFLKAADMATLRQLGSPLQGHPHVGALPWVETSTGSLGQGASVAVGMALGLRHQDNTHRVYAILGDGELQEGQIWEAAMGAAHYQLSNLCFLIDYNKLQSDAPNAEIMGLEPLTDKWRAFGWHTQILDGHVITDLYAALNQARAETEKPSVLICNTVKGKGVSYMEHAPEWHGSVKLTDAQTAAALEGLGLGHTDRLAWLKGEIHGSA
ncbi:MAG: transketolase [Pseudomonadota bacterium]